MCGRYNFSADSSDEKMSALIQVMERKYPGEYKTGDIFPGDTAPAMRGKKRYADILERHKPAFEELAK